jgi:hypothetical protein
MTDTFYFISPRREAPALHHAERLAAHAVAEAGGGHTEGVRVWENKLRRAHQAPQDQRERANSRVAKIWIRYFFMVPGTGSLDVCYFFSLS